MGNDSYIARCVGTEASEQMRSNFEAWAKPDSIQKRRTVCGSGYVDVGMDAAWSAWQAATQKAEAENKEKVMAIEAKIAQLDHALKNEKCASQLMQHLADQSERKAKRLAEELSILRAQELA